MVYPEFFMYKGWGYPSTFYRFNALPSEKEHNDAHEPRVEFNGFSVLVY